MHPIHSILVAIALTLILTAISAAPIIAVDPITTTTNPLDDTTAGHLPFLNIGSLGFGRRAAEPEAFVVRPDIIIR